MFNNYSDYNVRQLRETVWDRGLLPKKWMLNYVKKDEALTLLAQEQLLNGNLQEEVIPEYTEEIKVRVSEHRAKSYRAKKDRKEIFGIQSATREERLKSVLNKIGTLEFREKQRYEENFTSSLGSTRGNIAFIFTDPFGDVYQFTKNEVQLLLENGLELPRGILTSFAPNNSKASIGPKLKDIFDV